MQEYKIQQKCTVWIQTRVEADSLDEALTKASEAMDDGDFMELADTYDFTGKFYAMDEDGEELEIPEEWS